MTSVVHFLVHILRTRYILSTFTHQNIFMETAEHVLVALRRILRAIDLHSKTLAHEQGLTVPQLIVLRAISSLDTPTISDVAKAVSLSNATLSAILDRMERRGYLERIRSTVDKRKVHISITPVGESLLLRSPSPLHEQFLTRFNNLKDWEQNLILASLQRVAAMMDRDGLEVAPILAVEPMSPDEPADMPTNQNMMTSEENPLS